MRKLLETAESQEGSSLVLQKWDHSRQDVSRALSSLLSPTVPENISIRSTDRITNENYLESVRLFFVTVFPLFGIINRL